MNLFSYISAAWQFYRKQPVLNVVGFWFLFVPPTIIDLISIFAEKAMAQDIRPIDLQEVQSIDFALTVLAIVFLLYFTIWGQASTLLIGKRIISSPAGRNRTSFKAVRGQSRKYIGPLLLTMVIRIIKISLLSIGVVIPVALSTVLSPLVTAIVFAVALLPGIIYAIQTSFYDIVIVSGKEQYFKALKESRNIVKGKTGKVLLVLAGMSIIILGPTFLFDLVMKYTVTDSYPVSAPYVSIVSNAIGSFALIFFQLTAICFYKDLKGNTGVVVS